MATPYVSSGAVVGVRLSDIPIKIRRQYGRALYENAARDGDLALALKFHAAMERPSERVYWLSAVKVREVRERQKW